MTRNRQTVLDQLGDDGEVVFYEPSGMDAAIIGVSAQQPGRPSCVVYDYQKLVTYFRREGMSPDDAVAWLESNTIGSWLGEHTPIVIERIK